MLQDVSQESTVDEVVRFCEADKAPVERDPLPLARLLESTIDGHHIDDRVRWPKATPLVEEDLLFLLAVFTQAAGDYLNGNSSGSSVTFVCHRLHELFRLALSRAHTPATHMWAVSGGRRRSSG